MMSLSKWRMHNIFNIVNEALQSQGLFCGLLNRRFVGDYFYLPIELSTFGSQF